MRHFLVSDLPEMNGWYASRGKGGVSEDMLPVFGLIEPGVAAGFLYLTDSSLCLLEGFVSNPESEPMAAFMALGRIVRGLTVEAEKAGCRHVVGFTNLDGMVSVTRRQGFRANGQYEMVAREVV